MYDVFPRRHQVLKLLEIELLVHLVCREILSKHCKDFLDVLRFHRAHTSLQFQFDIFVKCELFLETCHRVVLGQSCETYFHKLLGVKITVVISRRCERSGENNTGSVDSLPDVLKVDPARDLLDQQRSQFLGP